MTIKERNEKWNIIVAQLDEIGMELQELAENEDGDMISEEAENALYSLRMTQMELESVTF